jgi:hypothetical protein
LGVAVVNELHARIRPQPLQHHTVGGLIGVENLRAVGVRAMLPLLGRLLHDRTPDKIARAVSDIPDAAATIAPYDVQSRIREAFPDLFEERITRGAEKVQARITDRDQQRLDTYEHPAPPPLVVAVDGLIPGHLATVEGRVSEVDDTTRRAELVRVAAVGDDSGELRVTFSSGRGGDIQPGQLLRITGKARQRGHRPVWMNNPTYRVVEDPERAAAAE